MRQFKILTYNVHKGFDIGNQAFVLHQIRDALRETEADILFLQEMQGEHTEHPHRYPNWPQCSQAEFLAEQTWPHAVYGKNAVYSSGHHGNAILSKYALCRWENINVSPFVWASRSLLHGVIQLPDQRNTELHIICIHLGLIGMERRRQFKQLCQRIEQCVPLAAPLIIAGDFNDWTGQAEKRFYKQFALNEAYQTLHQRYARTFPVWMPFLTMDRIYYRGFRALDCERLKDSPWNRLSDHAPLLATLELENVEN